MHSLRIVGVTQLSAAGVPPQVLQKEVEVRCLQGVHAFDKQEVSATLADDRSRSCGTVDIETKRRNGPAVNVPACVPCGSVLVAREASTRIFFT